MPLPVRRATVALVLLGAGTLTACSTDEPAAFDPEPAAAAELPENGTAVPDKPTAEPEDGAASAEPVRTGPVGPDDAVQTITFDLPGADPREEATVTVGLHSLRVEGEVMALELSFTPEFKGDGTYGIYDMHDDVAIHPVINDRANLKQYTVLGGYNGWQTDTGPLAPEARSGQTLQYWGYFAAPEDDIDTVSVGVGMVEFTDVTIER